MNCWSRPTLSTSYNGFMHVDEDSLLQEEGSMKQTDKSRINGKSCTASRVERGKDDGRDEHILKRQRQATRSSITRETATGDGN
jgi:hypothetical protein